MRTDNKKWEQNFKSSPRFQIQKKEPDVQSASQPSTFGFSCGRNLNGHSLHCIGWNRAQSDQQRNVLFMRLEQASGKKQTARSGLNVSMY